METSPLVLREATGHQMPILMYNLPVYLDYYDKFSNIEYLDWNDLQFNIEKIIKKTHMENEKTNFFRLELNKESNQIFIYYQNQELLNVSISIADIDCKHAIYAYDSAFENYSFGWCTPIPAEALSKVNASGYFRGYEVTFWNRQRNTIIEKHLVWYNPDAKKYDHTVFVTNPWNFTFFNYNEMFIEKNYEKTNAKIGGVCLDVGANDGIFTEWLLQFNIDKVYSIECDPRALSFIDKKFNNNSKVVVVNKALWKENTNEMKLYYVEDTSVFSSLKENGNCNSENYFTVSCWDFKTLKNKYNIKNINFMKLDIEGGEYEVIESMTDDEITNIESFLIEIHLNKNGKIYQITNRLKSLGYNIQFTEHHNHTLLIDESQWKNHEWGYLTATK
jgi:hypothetical protein